MAQLSELMQKHDVKDLSLEELRAYPGFEDMTEAELEKALLFIYQFAEILLEI